MHHSLPPALPKLPTSPHAPTPLPVVQSHPSLRAHQPASDGPGWYESSWDLARGLDVAELVPLDEGVAIRFAAGPVCSFI
jgi:hypothetical protein